MARELSEMAVRSLIQASVEDAGGQTALAKKWRVSQTYISQVVTGTKRPGPKLCDKVNVARVDRDPIYHRLNHPSERSDG